MNYYGYRYYAADAGRWINRDPIVEKGGNNVYAMIGNNSLLMYDFLGLLMKTFDEAITYGTTSATSRIAATTTPSYKEEMEMKADVIKDKNGNSTDCCKFTSKGQLGANVTYSLAFAKRNSVGTITGYYVPNPADGGKTSIDAVAHEAKHVAYLREAWNAFVAEANAIPESGKCICINAKITQANALFMLLGRKAALKDAELDYNDYDQYAKKYDPNSTADVDRANEIAGLKKTIPNLQSAYDAAVKASAEACK